MSLKCFIILFPISLLVIFLLASTSRIKTYVDEMRLEDENRRFVTSLSTDPKYTEEKVHNNNAKSENTFYELNSQMIPVIDHKFAYVTLLHGIGFLYNTLIIKKALDDLGSVADFIVLLGFRGNQHYNNCSLEVKADIDLLISHKIKIFFLPRFLNNSKQEVNFAEMALLKIIPWSLIQYERIQYFDGDVMPIRNMDCFFDLNVNAFNSGAASPLNSGWYLAIPNMKIFNILKDKALWRLNLKKWDTKLGWGQEIPKQLTFRNGQVVKDWNFNGASLDQGLLTHFYVMNHGSVMIIDTKKVKRYDAPLQPESIDTGQALKSCSGKIPTDHFAHFTGRNKPWLKLSTGNSDKNVRRWASYLDSLALSVNSSNIAQLQLRPPLGYFYPNK